MNGNVNRRAVRALTACLLASVALVRWTSAGAQDSYQSVFDAYPSSREAGAPTDWRGANRQAGELGGFVGQMRASPRVSAAPSRTGETTGRKPEGVRGMQELLATLRSTRPADESAANRSGPDAGSSSAPQAPAPATESGMRR